MFRLGLRSVPMASRMAAMAGVVGVSTGAGAMAWNFRAPIRCDAVNPSRVGPGDSLAQAASPTRGHGISHFDGKLDYHQLTFGSFIGMVSGWAFGKISKLLVALIVTSLLTSEYLSSAGWIDLKPFYSSVYRFTSRHFNQEIMVQDPSFKYSFLAAFAIAAYNA